MRQGSVVRQLLPLLRRRRVPLTVMVGLGILTALTEGLGLSLFLPLFYRLQEQSLPLGDASRLGTALHGILTRFLGDPSALSLSLVILAALVVKNLLRFGNSILSSWMDARLVHDLRTAVMDRLLRADLQYVEQTEAGRHVNALDGETWDTSTAVLALANLACHAATILVFVGLLLLLSWQTTLLVAAALAVISTLLWRLTRRVARLSYDSVSADQAYLQRTLEILRGMRTIRAYGLEAAEQQRFGAAAGRVRSAFFRMECRSNLIYPVSELLMATLLVGILLTTLHDIASLPVVLTFLFVLYRLYPQLQHFDATRTQLLSFTAPVATVTRLLEAPLAEAPGQPPRLAPHFEKEITFDHVAFQYAGTGTGLRDVSFCIPRGGLTAIVGPSGAGKSTILALLLGFYRPDRGCVRIDGCSLEQLDLVGWRSRLGVVLQDPHLFSASIYENIACGSRAVTREAVEAAARQAHAHDFIRALPQGYDTHVADLGTRLSGGQRQRLALARALVRDPDVLLLDEATNALDSLSEQAIRRTLDAERERRTLIVVAHRLATIRQARHIIVLDEGRVVEQGSFGELLRPGTLFSRLYEMQHAPDAAEVTS